MLFQINQIFSSMLVLRSSRIILLFEQTYIHSNYYARIYNNILRMYACIYETTLLEEFLLNF